MKSRFGFTLIELLVVMAIIAIIVAIIFPTFAMAQRKAHESACLSNLKQLGMAMRMYASDWDGLPVTEMNIDHNPHLNWAGVESSGWICIPEFGSLFPYVKNEDVYFCPDDEDVPTPCVPCDVDGATFTSIGAIPMPISYTMNPQVACRNLETIHGDISRIGLLVQESRSTIKDATFHDVPPDDTSLPSQTHNYGSCVLYCDLHAAWASYDSLRSDIRKGLWNPDGQ